MPVNHTRVSDASATNATEITANGTSANKQASGTQSVEALQHAAKLRRLKIAIGVLITALVITTIGTGYCVIVLATTTWNDPCDSVACANGGSCFTQGKSAVCVCAQGFTGKECETRTSWDACDTLECLNGATCSNQGNLAACVCVPGFTGTECETEIDECASGPCLNAATCRDQVGGYVCECRPGFTGTRCETDIDDCQSNQCENGATCVDRVNAYVCDCAPGFTGTVCETEIDECESDPCEYGGTCTDRVNGYVCDCEPGFTGARCEIDVECASGPCLNDATCLGGGNGYTCTCVLGFTGTHCETNIDDCAGVYCFNFGTCVDGINAYTCRCPSWASGQHCETDLCIPLTTRPLPILIQKHHDATSFFNKTWVQMRAQQIDPLTGDFWLGLDTIRDLTHEGQYKLRIEFNTTKGTFFTAEYRVFIVENEESRFKLSVSNYTRLVEDLDDVLIAAHNGKTFATWDNANADDPGAAYVNSAVFLGGGFWYGEYDDFTPPSPQPPIGKMPACRACFNSSPDDYFGWFRIVGDPLLLTESKMLLDCR